MTKPTELWMPFYIKNFYAKTAHLSTPERECYRTLLDMYWLRHKGLPTDEKELARLAHRTLKEWRAVAPKVLQFFSLEADGLLHNGRADELLTEAAERHQKRVRAGSRGRSREEVKPQLTSPPLGVIEASDLGDSNGLAGAMLQHCPPHVQVQEEREKKDSCLTLGDSEPPARARGPEVAPPRGGPDGRAVAGWFTDAHQPAQPQITPELRERAVAADAARNAAFERWKAAWAEHEKEPPIQANSYEEQKRLELEWRQRMRAEVDAAMSAWQAARDACVPDVPTATPGIEIEVHSGKRVAHGWYIDEVFERVIGAARINPVQFRGDQTPLVAWLRDGLKPDDIVEAIRKRASKDGYYPPFSLAWFDPLVRSHRRAAA